jgi:DNA repair protein RecO (recombination protein O)
MAPPRTYRCEALTLKKSPFGEADLIVTLYSAERGKIRAIAKGARRSNSKLVGHLEPLTQVRLSLAQGRNLDIITQAQLVESFLLLKADLGAVSKGVYLAELVDGFGSEEHANYPLYRLSLDTLQALAVDPDSEWPLRFFEFHLLRVSGMLPELYYCVECRRVLQPGQHRFSPEVGGALCLECRPTNAQVWPLSVRALKVLRLFHRSSIAELPPLPTDLALDQELKTLLSSTVGYWLDKEIRSNSFLDHLSKEQGDRVYK